MLGMAFRHVPWLCSHAWIIFPDMSGDAFVMKIDLNQLVTGMQLNLFAHAVMRRRIEVLVVDQVIIGIDASGFDVRILISVFRQRCQGWFIQRFKPLLTTTWHLL